MDKRPLPIVCAAAALVILAVLFYPQSTDETPTFPPGEGLGVSYTDVNSQLRLVLKRDGISMSPPIIFDDPVSIRTYCNFFEGEEQTAIKHCTSTELLDPDGEFLGNVHVFGTPESAKRLMAVIQVDPFLENKDRAKTVFAGMTDSVVCPCWNLKNEDGLSMDDWAEAYLSSHIAAARISSASNTIHLEDGAVQMRLITNTLGYEWQILVA